MSAVSLCCWASPVVSLLCETAADSDTSRPAHSEPVIRNAHCFSVLFCLPIERKINRTMVMLPGLWGEPKKAPKPLDNTDKQIFLYVISKSSIWLAKCSFKGEKYICFYALLWHTPASLMMLSIRTVQRLRIFFGTLQYSLFTQLLKNLSALGVDSRTLIHVLKQHFHLPWKTNPSATSRTTVCWFSKLIRHLSEKMQNHIWTCRFWATS